MRNDLTPHSCRAPYVLKCVTKMFVYVDFPNIYSYIFAYQRYQYENGLSSSVHNIICLHCQIQMCTWISDWG